MREQGKPWADVSRGHRSSCPRWGSASIPGSSIDPVAGATPPRRRGRGAHPISRHLKGHGNGNRRGELNHRDGEQDCFASHIACLHVRDSRGHRSSRRQASAKSSSAPSALETAEREVPSARRTPVHARVPRPSWLREGRGTDFVSQPRRVLRRALSLEPSCRPPTLYVDGAPARSQRRPHNQSVLAGRGGTP